MEERDQQTFKLVYIIYHYHDRFSHNLKDLRPFWSIHLYSVVDLINFFNVITE